MGFRTSVVLLMVFSNMTALCFVLKYDYFLSCKTLYRYHRIHGTGDPHAFKSVLRATMAVGAKDVTLVPKSSKKQQPQQSALHSHWVLLGFIAGYQWDVF